MELLLKAIYDKHSILTLPSDALVGRATPCPHRRPCSTTYGGRNKGYFMRLHYVLCVCIGVSVFVCFDAMHVPYIKL